LAEDAKLLLDSLTLDLHVESIPVPSIISILDWEIEDILDTCLLLLLLMLLFEDVLFPMDVPESISSKSASIDLKAPPALLLGIEPRGEPKADASKSSISDDIPLAAVVSDEDTFEDREEEETELLETFVEDILLLSFTEEEVEEAESDDARSIITFLTIKNSKL